ncbi:hypothetical protein N7468_009732 [Penicillium chermesinum]|uniref:Uncharacterized protein n=1 Tax=Penicillium chermesinum TaxID=63820 RepID=A0A9W9NIS8_9EURO|nr:uncharacterized protein N7468_009732 [Penicillium chermesinum]KAJ5220528.1 hypothetical protein N7468_009732 [Penicillium chermesinum]
MSKGPKMQVQYSGSILGLPQKHGQVEDVCQWAAYASFYGSQCSMTLGGYSPRSSSGVSSCFEQESFAHPSLRLIRDLEVVPTAATTPLLNPTGIRSFLGVFMQSMT